MIDFKDVLSNTITISKKAVKSIFLFLQAYFIFSVTRLKAISGDIPALCVNLSQIINVDNIRARLKDFAECCLKLMNAYI